MQAYCSGLDNLKCSAELSESEVAAVFLLILLAFKYQLARGIGFGFIAIVQQF
jgi:hypothetical protein